MFSILKKIFNKKNNDPISNTVKEKYPFIYHENEYSLKYCINNPIEEFRIVSWGGEEAYVKQMVAELKSNDVFFDIGSSVGLVSVMAADKLTNGIVISFEPDPENLVRLKKNFELNNLKNFIIQPLAVGELKTKMRLYTDGSNANSPSLHQVNGIERTIMVEVDSIDRLLRDEIVPFPTVIKMDIEGAEMLALKGMEELLNSGNRPRILYIEIHPDFLPSFGTDSNEIFEYLEGFKYTVLENVQRNKQILCTLERVE